MADYGAWQGLGNAVQTGMDAFGRAKAAKRESLRRAEQDAMQKELFDLTLADKNPNLPNPFGGSTPVTRPEAFAAELEKQKLENARKLAGMKKEEGKPLPTTGINMENLASFPVDMKNLASLADDVEKNTDVIGPWAGRAAKASSWLPSDLQPEMAVRGQKIQSKIDNLKQTIGRAKEGGVLRKEDEEKYNRILATLSDNPNVAASKIKNIYNEMSQKYNETIKLLDKQGYRTAGLSPISGLDDGNAKRKSLAQQILQDKEAGPDDIAWAQSQLGM